MKHIFAVAFISLVLVTPTHATDPSSYTNDLPPISAGWSTTSSRLDEVPSSPYLKVTLKKMDFNDNTFSEIVVKLNSIIREQLKKEDGPLPTILINLKGLSQAQISRVLNSKIIHDSDPLKDVSLGETLAYISQFMNCTSEMKNGDYVFIPLAPYNLEITDIDATRKKLRETGHL